MNHGFNFLRLLGEHPGKDFSVSDNEEVTFSQSECETV